LRLNEDLVEAISLAHDLGHTPFGHAGQEALNACMHDHGGFEHNLQSLRTVDLLEERYAAFDGLNLCFETREGSSSTVPWKTRAAWRLGERFLNRTQPSLEAQICNLADEIAYNNHDVDDGLRAGLITLEQLAEVPACSPSTLPLSAGSIRGLGGRRLIHETIRRMINALVCDLIETTASNIADYSRRTSLRRAACAAGCILR
jgi:dGTPase